MDKGLYTFFKGYSSKVNVIARPEFELAYNDVVDRHVNHNATVTTPISYDNSLYAVGIEL